MKEGGRSVGSGAPMTRFAYPNDLTDAEWNVLRELLPPNAPVGRPRKWSVREILDGIFYVVRGGIAWRARLHDFPPWQTIYHYHRLWRLQGVWEALHVTLREWVRQREGWRTPGAPDPLAGAGHTSLGTSVAQIGPSLRSGGLGLERVAAGEQMAGVDPCAGGGVRL